MLLTYILYFRVPRYTWYHCVFSKYERRNQQLVTLAQKHRKRLAWICTSNILSYLMHAKTNSKALQVTVSLAHFLTVHFKMGINQLICEL